MIHALLPLLWLRIPMLFISENIQIDNDNVNLTNGPANNMHHNVF